MLEPAGLRKIATDSGFDALEGGSEWLAAASTQAPQRACLGLSPRGPVLGLSMQAVLAELRASTAMGNVPTGLPGAGWIEFAGLGMRDRALLQSLNLSRALPNHLGLRFNDQLSTLSSTKRDASVRRSMVQTLFRERLMTLWHGRCAITGLYEPELLRAIHTKLWAVSTDADLP